MFVTDSFQITHEEFLSVSPVKVHVEEVICRNGRLEWEDNECRLYITKNLVSFLFFKFLLIYYEECIISVRAREKKKISFYSLQAEVTYHLNWLKC